MEPDQRKPTAREHWAGMYTWQRALIVIGSFLVVAFVVGTTLVQIGERQNEQARWDRYFERILEE